MKSDIKNKITNDENESIQNVEDEDEDDDSLVYCNDNVGDPKICLVISYDDKITNNNDNQNDDDMISIGAIELQWQNLTFEIINKSVGKFKTNVPDSGTANHQYYRDHRRRRLLQSLNGSIRTGEMTALIGPSGSGKTTLLECISGRNKLSQGMINVCTTTTIVNKKLTESIRLAYLSHSDTMMMILTVQETLLFASKLMTSHDDCKQLEAKQITNNLITKLGLESCKNIYVGRCSNGQQKRLSIALELLFSPTILLLDEPTSGLDSVACFQTIRLLRELADDHQQPIAIMLSIHQPTASMLKYFDNLYVMAMDGHCLYRGPSNQMVDYLAANNLQCPTYHNPADFIVEIGVGNLCDMNTVERLIMAAKAQQQPQESMVGGKMIPIKKIIQQSRSITNEFNIRQSMQQFFQLWLRSVMLQYRNPSEILTRVFGTGIVIFIIWLIYKDMRLGENDSCYRPLIRNMIRDRLENNKTSISNDFEWSKQMLEESHNQFNYAFLFFIEMFIAFISTLPVLLTFPMEIIVIRRELSHGWYRLPIYFLAKNMVTILPSLIISISFATTIYFITDQPLDQHWRFIYFNIILMLMALVGGGVGQLISALFVKQANQALIFAALSQMGLILFSGLFVPNSSLPVPLKHMTYVSQYRLGFESLIISIYGYDRCRIFNDLDDDYQFLTNDALLIRLFRHQFPNNDTMLTIKKCLRNQMHDDEQETFYSIYNEIFDSFDMIAGIDDWNLKIENRSIYHHHHDGDSHFIFPIPVQQTFVYCNEFNHIMLYHHDANVMV
ncbi:ATP-binding cassette sub-family G member 1 [Dermatophagoides farinae]|uniref:ATP-binding cassette sub-family G member 1 n=1 Tax=Dermatophagoides farinae TaxID=6954 RepID=UPI003F620F42